MSTARLHAEHSPPVGAARKARERRARANARHVQWLASTYQCLATHHTNPGMAATPVAAPDMHVSTASEVAALRQEVHQLQEELARLRGAVAAVVAVQAGGERAEAEKMAATVVDEGDIAKDGFSTASFGTARYGGSAASPFGHGDGNTGTEFVDGTAQDDGSAAPPLEHGHDPDGKNLVEDTIETKNKKAKHTETPAAVGTMELVGWDVKVNFTSTAVDMNTVDEADVDTLKDTWEYLRERGIHCSAFVVQGSRAHFLRCSREAAMEAMRPANGCTVYLPTFLSSDACG